MPSAVALTYTRDGFVFAADGLARDNDGREVSKTTQKVFQAGNLPMAYSLCGRVAFDTKDKENAVNLLKDAPYGITAISGREDADLTSYAFSFGSYLYAILKKAQDTTDLEPFPTKQTDRQGGEYDICHVFLAGYWNEQPGWRFISLRHRDQILLEPRVFTSPLQKGPRIYGSGEIETRLFKNDDPALCLYRVKGFQDSEQPSLSDGIEALKNYILACCDPEIKTFDPEICKAIGGRIHIATVTPKNGFEWVCPPKTTIVACGN